MKGGLGKETDGRLNAMQQKATPRVKAATETADGFTRQSAAKSYHLCSAWLLNTTRASQKCCLHTDNITL